MRDRQTDLNYKVQDRKLDADHRIVFMRPHLARSIARVIGIVLASMLLIGSVVLFLGRLLGQGEAS